ncbi:MAG: TonB-dependent receptor [Bacteroidota bacterium]
MVRDLLIIGLLFYSITLPSQERLLINYLASDKSLFKVFKELERDYDIHFSFSVKDIGDKKVNIKAKDQPLIPFLDSLLGGHQLTYKIFSKSFIAITAPSKLFIRFQLQDQETGETLPFATARIHETTQGFVSDGEGFFEISIPNSRETILELSFLGYQEKQLTVAEIDSLNTISLKKNPITLEEIVVKEYLNKGITIDDEAIKISINAQNMEILPGLSERDILLSAQILAGIGSADESAGGLNVRGSSRDNTFIYWNNIPVYHSAHYFGNISAFIPSSLEKVDIFKNYIPVNYGGASSGLLLMTSRKPETIVLETNLNLTHGDMYASVPFAEYTGQISIAARRSFNDILATPTFNSISDKLFEGSLTENAQSISNNFQYNSKLIFHDFNLTLDFSPNKLNDFSFSFLNSISELDYDSQDSDRFLQSEQQHDVNNRGTNVTWIRQWNNLILIKVSTSYANYEMDYALINTRNEEDESNNNDVQERINNLQNIESRFSLIYSPFENHVFDVGYQFNRVKSDFTFLEDFFFEENVFQSIETKGNTHGFFTGYFGKFKFGLQVGIGLRQNIYTSLNKYKLDRQLRLNYKLSSGIMLKSSFGVYHQYISSLKEDDFIFSTTIEQNWLTADSEFGIPVIKNEQLVLGAMLSKSGWVVDLDGYVKDVFTPLLWNFGGQSAEEETIISGTERIRGADLTIKKRWKYYRTWLSYTFQDSKVDAFEQRFPSRINTRHQLQFSQTLNYSSFEFSLGYTLKSGLPFTNYIRLDQATLENGESGTFPEIEYESWNSSRLPYYHRVDFSAWYKFNVKKRSNFSGEVGISILNLFDRGNLYSRTFMIEEDANNELFISERERALIGITPNLSIRLKF